MWKTIFKKYIIPLFDIKPFKNNLNIGKNDIKCMWKIQKNKNEKMQFK